MPLEEEWAEAQIQQALKATSLHLDLDVGAEVAENLLESLRNLSASLRADRFEGKSFAEKARALNHVMKTLDELERLMAFAKGQPDSRPEQSQQEWLRALTEEQLRQVEGWVKENARQAHQLETGD